MADTIREQIISALLTRAGQIKKSRGFNTDIGKNPIRAFNIPVGYEDLPAVSLFPNPEEETGNYGNPSRLMPVRFIGQDKIGSYDPSVKAEKIKGDIEEAFSGQQIILPFTSGGTYTIQAGHTITGETSGFTATVELVELASGAWASGDATGNLTIRRIVGIPTSETIKIGLELDVATVSNVFTHKTPSDVCGGGLFEYIVLDTGGTESYPQEGAKSIACEIVFNVSYKVAPGNPYSQK